MSYKEKGAHIGKTAQVTLGGLTIDVWVLDYKNSYGKDRWLVSPTAGSGEVWVESIIPNK